MAKRSKSSTGVRAEAHIALMRGINVGGRHMLPMAALRVIFEKAGCTSVRTYIQSGNVVFDASPSVVKDIRKVVGRHIAQEFDFEPAIVLRSGGELRRLVEKNPFGDCEMDHKILHVGFLQDAPSAAQVAALDPGRSPGDRFVVRGRDIFLHTPKGLADTRFTNAYFDSVLKSPSTFRNWRTVLRLAEMVVESE